MIAARRIFPFARPSAPNLFRIARSQTFVSMAAASASFSEPAVIGVVPEYTSGVEPIAFRSQAQLTAGTVVFVGEQAHIEAAAQASDAVGTFLAQNPVVKSGLVDCLSSASDSAVTSETKTVDAATGKVQRVVAITLPKIAGRHNCAARPHAIRAALVGASLSDLSRVQAAALASPRAFPAYTRKTASKSATTVGVSFTVLNGAPVDESALSRFAILSSSIRMAGTLVDQPTSELHTDAFVDIATEVAKEAGGSIHVIKGTELREKGYGGLWGVGQASVHLPALAILTYVPEGVSADAPSICMVGKGIVYDTGGLSIKSKDGMPGMKKDMGGAAGILGAWRSLALQGALKQPLHALLCLAENSVSKEAQRPDDVITLFSGKTVELNNTDAEGRLVLGDGVAHSVKFLNPQYIFDMATLTGAAGIATGRNHGALYCNDDALEASVVVAGKVTGDLTHAMPFAPEFYRAEFASPVADMKNSVKDRANAQPSCAGQFIGNHMGDFLTEGKWCHIDMGYPASAGGRGTGYGVALLEEVAKALSK